MSEDFNRDDDLQFSAQPYLFEPEYTDDKLHQNANSYVEEWHKRRNCSIKTLFLFSLHTKSSFIKRTTDVTWTILTVSLLPFWALNVLVALLSIQSQKALGFHQNILICVLKMNKGLMGLEQHEGE